MKVGDRVRYSSSFCQSIGAFTGDIPFARGTITGMFDIGKNLTMAEVDWGYEDVPPKVNIKNLEKCP